MSTVRPGRARRTGTACPRRPRHACSALATKASSMSPPATRPFYGQKLQRPGPRPRRRWGHRAVLRGWRERWHGGRLWSASLGRAAGCGGPLQQLEAKGELKCAEGQGLPAAFRLLRRPDPRRGGERRPDRSERDERRNYPLWTSAGGPGRPSRAWSVPSRYWSCAATATAGSSGSAGRAGGGRRLPPETLTPGTRASLNVQPLLANGTTRRP